MQVAVYGFNFLSEESDGRAGRYETETRVCLNTRAVHDHFFFFFQSVIRILEIDMSLMHSGWRLALL
jgi:hypothetical protein